MPLQRFIRSFLNLPLRRKLILSFLAVIGIGGVATLSVGTRLEHRTIFSLAQAKVRHDLSSAWMVYHDKLSSIQNIIRMSAGREFVERALISGKQSAWKGTLSDIRREFNLDVLTLTDARGIVVFRAQQPDSFGDDQSGDPLVKRALGKETAAGTQTVDRATLLKEGRDLADRAFFRFIPTPKAAERPEDQEENGMMLNAASPVVDKEGALLGVLYGGILLNRNYEIVDLVKEMVFKGEKYKGKEIGTVTIFQGDLRISTNVMDDTGNRAVGTRVSREVNETVLRQGKPWVGRAFVVSHWYISAYEPIKDANHNVIGMLYVGMLEKPYIDLRNNVMLTFTGIAVLFMAFLLALLSLFTSTIIKPLRSMVAATNKIARGDLSHRVEIDFRDEIGQLAHSFNLMTEDLKTANENLVQWGKTLEKRVEERTRELREMQGYLIQSEKLASLGKMAAGVAHEINNPLTSILINAHLMLEKGDLKNEYQENLTLIAEETSRCAQIVKGLLEFARQTPSRMTWADINELIDRTTQLLEKQAAVRNINIVKDLNRSLPFLELDKNKIQQVFWNLMLNACEAMPSGGVLTIRSRLGSDGRDVEIVFADTGVGIPQENIHKLFDPFFTTKSSGTGLGLAVTYGIIHRHGGTIDVKSEVGQGAIFTVTIPLEKKGDEDKNHKEAP